MPYFPTLSVDIAFATNPGSAPTYEDVSPYVKAASYRRGRQHELERMNAGTGKLKLANGDGRFTPENTASPYYPNVLPMRRGRIRATWNAVTEDLFHFYIESWPPETDRSYQEAFVEVSLVDAFKPLNLVEFTTTRSQELAGTRITAIADAIGWPAVDRDIDVGKSQMQGVVYTKAKALEEMQNVTSSENGSLYISRDGKLKFMDREAVIAATFDPATHTWGDIAGEHRYQSVEPVFDDTDIWPEVKATRTGGIEQAVSDATSIDRYFKRTLSRDGLLLTSDSETLDYAQFLLARYSEPALRITEMELDPKADQTQWPHILHHDLLDKIRIRKRPLIGDLIEQDSFIEGIGADISRTAWRVMWRLSPTDRVTDFWVLDDPVQSVVGTSTRLGY